VISGAPITVSLSSGSYQPLVAVTDGSGQVSGNIGIGSDKSNRIITATFTDGLGVSGTASITVSGAQISITPLPQNPLPGAPLTITLKATDANNQAIAGAAIQFSGIPFTGTLPVTDNAGTITISTTAPATAGTYALTAVGLGVTSTQSLLVSGGGTIPDVTVAISAASLSVNPNTIGYNAPGSTANRAALRAVFRDASNQAIQNVRVRFEIVGPSQSAGEQLSTGANIVYSDSSGAATADYIAGTTASPNNGVQLRACYGSTDADLAGGACPSSAAATLTVAGQPVSITLGSNNELAKTASNTMYVKTLVAVVNDSSGRAVSGANVSYSVDVTHYGKGYSWADAYYVNLLTTPLITAPDVNTPGINTTDVPVAPTPPTPPSTEPVGDGQRVWCPNEDTDRSSFLNGGEDINGNGTLEPRAAQVSIVPASGSAVTGTDGTLLLKVQWPMDYATWLAFTVKVSTSVGGTEGTDEMSFVTSFVEGDERNGSFIEPPFGVGNCQSPN
jgi:hypothetical protein